MKKKILPKPLKTIPFNSSKIEKEKPKIDKVFESLSKAYNLTKKNETGRQIKKLVVEALLAGKIDYTSMKKDFGMKISSNFVLKTKENINQKFVPRKPSSKRKDKYENIRKFVDGFLKENSTPAANRTIRVKDQDEPVRILSDSIRGLYSKLIQTEFYKLLQPVPSEKNSKIRVNVLSQSYFYKLIKDKKI